MFLAAVGDSVPVFLVLSDRVTTLFPQAVVYDGAAVIATIALTHVSNGYYQSTWTPTYAGRFAVIYNVYQDSGHSTLEPDYAPADDEVTVLPFPLGTESGVVRSSVTLDANSNAIIVNTWLELDFAPVTVGITNATLTLYTSQGVALSTPAAQPSPDANGVFRFVFPPPAFGIGETATYVVATISMGARAFRGVTGVTFSRSS